MFLLCWISDNITSSQSDPVWSEPKQRRPQESAVKNSCISGPCQNKRSHFRLSCLCLFRKQGSASPAPSSPGSKAEKKCPPCCLRHKRSIQRISWQKDHLICSGCSPFGGHLSTLQWWGFISSPHCWSVGLDYVEWQKMSGETDLRSEIGGWCVSNLKQNLFLCIFFVFCLYVSSVLLCFHHMNAFESIMF